MVDGEIPKNKTILPYLYINNFKLKRLHTFILMDDAAFVLKMINHRGLNGYVN